MKHYKYIFIILIFVLTNSCRKVDVVTEIDETEYTDWTETTHSNNVDPDYSVVFEQNKVLRFDIEISSDNWNAMQQDLADNIGSGGGPGPGGGNFGDFTPIWKNCTFKFEDIEWYNVGMRFKGNSSLFSTYQMGNNKLSIKLDFDEFEDDYPELEDQRFYGFKQLNLNNNFDDASLMREKIGADMFREFGLVSAKTAFCVVYIDHGEGSQYYGVYALVEEVDDSVLESQFEDDSGNLYKPDGDAASFAQGTYNDSEMEKKSNEDEADYSDVESLYEIINSNERTTDYESWKTNLNSVFNVDIFLKWLAANTVIQNWDTYGKMTHNYFLYNNPSNSKLQWIPWDNNEAFNDGKMGGALSISLNEVGNNWPLIRYIIDDDEYKSTYQNYLQQFVDEVFVTSEMQNLYEDYYQLLKEYAYAEESGYSFLKNDGDFDRAVSELKTHVENRNTVVELYLSDK
ncbi:MAG: spore coat protein [Marinilabiliales bacterium]|nr:MAG: spore coat protein [Marinilabiliales bacterium]